MRRPLVLFGVLLLATTAAAQVAPKAVLRKMAGNYYLKHRDYPNARNEYLAALQIEPKYADAHYNLGVVYFFRLKDYPRAIYHFTRYARLNPDAPDIDQVRGLTFQSLEKIEERERGDYERALRAGTAEAIEGFVKENPLSPYVPDAKEKLRRIRDYETGLREHSRAVQQAFQTALARGTPESMDGFLATHPDAPQAPEARQLRDQWTTQRAQDRADFERARAAGSIEALEKFTADRPRSEFLAPARAEIERLKGAQKAYRIAAEARSVRALELFLTTYAGTPWAENARNLVTELHREAAAETVVAGSTGVAMESPGPPPVEAPPGAPPVVPAEGTVAPVVSDDVPGGRRKALEQYRTLIQEQ